MDDIQKLYNDLISEGLFTKEKTSFDKFKAILSDDTKRNTLKDDLVSEGLFSKDKATSLFDTKFNLSEKSSGSILEMSPQELSNDYSQAPLMEKTLAENKAKGEWHDNERKKSADNIIAKYDKDREQISYSLYNEGVDKKKVKESVTAPTQMPQDVLKTPDLGKAKFVKDWTDKKITDNVTVEDALTLTPKEAYRVTKGAHAIDVDDKMMELTDQKKWGVITELQKSYAGFIQGYSDSFINADNTKEEDELVRQAVDVAIKKADASGEIIKKNIETKYLNNYVNLLTTKSNTIYDNLNQILSPEELEIINKEAEYTKAVDDGKIERDPNYEQVLNITKQKLQPTGIYELSDSISVYKQELDNLPVEYKKASIAEKAQKDLQNYRDVVSKKKGDLANSFLSFSDAFDSAVERNLLKGLPNSVMSGLASAGIDFGEAWIAAESVQPGILNLTTTKNLRPSFEKSVVYHDPITGVPYEVGFSDKNQVSEIYDKNGYVAVLSDEDKLRIAEDVEKTKLYKKAKTNINGESLAYKGISTALDVGATVAMGYGMARGLNAVGIGGEAGALSKLGKTGGMIESQLLQGVPMFLQYWGNSTVDAVRSGDLSPQEAAWYGAATTAMEVAIEGINPLMGRVSQGLGRISQLAESMERRNVLAALGKYTTGQARTRGFVTYLKDMAGEQGEEILSLYTTPALNVVANQVLEGNFDTGLPSAEDWYETMAITTMATIIPATFSGVNDFNYLKSDKFFKESLYNATDLKYKESLSLHLDNLEKDGTITKEEKTKFNGLMTHLESKRAALDESGDDTNKSKVLREDIVGLYAHKYRLEQKKSNDEALDADINKEIEATQKELDTKIKKLQDIKKILPQANSSEGFATDQQDFEGKSGDIMGEDNISLTQPKTPVVEDVVSINPALRDVKSTKKALDEMFDSKPAYDLYHLVDNKFRRAAVKGLTFDLINATENRITSEAYHQAKKNGKNPELVKAVESLLSKEQTKTTQDAIQIENPNEEVLLSEQPEVGLQEMGKRDEKSQEITQENQKEENPLNLDMTKIDYTNPVGTMAIIKAKLQNDGILTFEDENGNKKENC